MGLWQALGREERAEKAEQINEAALHGALIDWRATTTGAEATIEGEGVAAGAAEAEEVEGVLPCTTDASQRCRALGTQKPKSEHRSVDSVEPACELPFKGAIKVAVRECEGLHSNLLFETHRQQLLDVRLQSGAVTRHLGWGRDLSQLGKVSAEFAEPVPEQRKSNSELYVSDPPES